MLIIVVIIIFIYLLFIRNRVFTTDYVRVVEEAMEKSVDGIAVTLEKVISLEDEEFELIDSDSSFVDGKLNDWEEQKELAWYATKLFGELNNLNEISATKEFKNSNILRLSLNVDFEGGSQFDEPHKFVILIDKELKYILVPEEYEIENHDKVSISNYRCLQQNIKTKDYVSNLVFLMEND